MKPITLPVILDNCIPKKDRSASIKFTTSLELTKEQHADFFENQGLHGILYFRAVEQLEGKEVETLDAIDLDLNDPKKTQSKRIRDVLYVYCQQEYGRKPTEQEFRDFYRVHTERIINQYKDKLEN